MTKMYTKLNNESLSEEDNEIANIIVNMYEQDTWTNMTQQNINKKLQLSVPRLNDICLYIIPYIKYTPLFNEMVIHIKNNIPYKLDE
jgi:hypothetical protein